MTDIINKCACTCHTDKYFDEPHIETCKRDGKNPNHPYTHPITPDAKSILRGALALAKITELEAFILVQEIFEEESNK